MKFISIILARGGSKNIPKKNIKKVYNQPLIGYSIKQCFDAGITDVYVTIIIHDKEFASILNHKMGSGNFGEVFIDRGNNLSGTFGKHVIRGTLGGAASSEDRVMRQNENNAGYKQIKYVIERQSIRYPLEITLRGDGTRESNIAQEKTHNLIDNIT